MGLAWWPNEGQRRYPQQHIGNRVNLRIKRVEHIKTEPVNGGDKSNQGRETRSNSAPPTLIAP
ncbi:MAG: Uncharacterised protein [Pseudidiomarina mangrovi]|nr:MAG: Uncharacterised protein [Pseudidiomarina mangrovi]